MNSKTQKPSRLRAGFTLVELLIVIVIIGILAAITIVSYKGIRASAIDKSVQNDVDKFNTAEVSYSLKHGGAVKAYNSGNGYDSDLGVSVTNGNIIDIVTNAVDYCIRGYNPNGTKKTAATAFIYESILGACTSLPASGPAPDLPPTSWAQVSVGWGYECGIASNSQAYCWGLNSNGQFGNGTTTNSSIPVPVDRSGVLNGLTILSISAGSIRTCAIASDHNAYCWGNNDNGELGDGTTNDSLVPVAVDTSGNFSGKTVLSISTGTASTCAIASNNLLYCWGDAGTGQLGNASGVDRSSPVPVSTSGVLSGKTILSVQVANKRACALASDHQVYCFGMNTYGQLGNSTKSDSGIPVAVTTSGALAGKTILKLALGVNSHSCVLASDNRPYCWGLNTSGQLGNGTRTDSSSPVAVDMTGTLSGKYVFTISTGSGNTCVVASDNEPYCWGVGDHGELGNNTFPSSVSLPTTVLSTGALNGKSLIDTQVGQTDICTIASDAQNYCWGDNTYGQLGNGNTNDSSVPSKVMLPAS